MNSEETQRAYDHAAQEYQRRLAHELDNKPFDRAWLVEMLRKEDQSKVLLDVGCGDGHVTGYLADQGWQPQGLDFSTEMIRVASTAFPDLSFHVGDMLHLPFDNASITTVLSMYSIVNMTAEDCLRSMQEMHRALVPNGRLLLAFHLGNDVVRADNFFNSGLALDFHFHPLQQVLDQLMSVGFLIESHRQRSPYPESIEAQTLRAYVVAAKAPD